MADAELGVVLRHIRTLAGSRVPAEASDGQLLERFARCREEAAFALLLRRHGPMVLGVARRVLRQVQDAEDVFQATFLLLIRKAASIRKHESVGSWLHGVAYRLAARARAQAARRQAPEKQAGTMRTTSPGFTAAWRELQAVLDEALHKLSEKYRSALVLWRHRSPRLRRRWPARYIYPGGGSFEGQEIKGRGNRLYKNLGNGAFRDVTREAGLDQPLFYSHGCAVTDCDCDGWPDLLVTGWGRMALYHNEPDGKGGRHFTDVTLKAGLPQGLWTISAAWADLDGDGFPDLYVCQYVNWSFANHPLCSGYRVTIARDICPPKSFTGLPHKLFRNNGNARSPMSARKPGCDRIRAIPPGTANAARDWAWSLPTSTATASRTSMWPTTRWIISCT